MTIDQTYSPLMPTYNRFPVTIQKGKGSYVWDEAGESFLDFTAGIGTTGLGHVPDRVKEALSQQLDTLWHCSNLYPISTQEKLADLLIENSVFDQAFFCNSGAEANEAAIKLARLYHQERHQIVTFKNSFHGRTMATLSATGQEKIQAGFDPLLQGFHYFPYNDYGCLTELADMLPAAVMLELVQGEGGVITADKEWVNQLANICQAHDILLIVDEVQTGMGRTGTLFAYEQYGIEPDIMTLAKALGSGFPIGAMLAKKQVATGFQPGTHGSTFGGNPLATTAALQTVKEITQSPILANVQNQSKRLFRFFNQLQKDFPVIKDVRGNGLLVGIEVDDQASKIVKQAINDHLLILVAGEKVVRLLPPLNVTDDDVDLFITTFQRVMETIYTG